MNNLLPITYKEFADKVWKRLENYHFASSESLVEIGLSEFAKLASRLPIAFISREDKFVPVAVQSLVHGQNLFVANDGRWLGSYLPSTYRYYPFKTATMDNAEEILCIDSDSGQIAQAGEGAAGVEVEPFFDSESQPSESIKNIMVGLKNCADDIKRTRAACGQIEDASLLIPWEITWESEGVARRTDGLYRIDESKLYELEPERFAILRDSGALVAVYGHLFSTEHLGALIQYQSTRLQSNKSELFSEHSMLGDTLNFDNL